jgi:hypothetical protein
VKSEITIVIYPRRMNATFDPKERSAEPELRETPQNKGY